MPSITSTNRGSFGLHEAPPKIAAERTSSWHATSVIAGPWILATLAVAACFAFRAGPPGFFQDWIWPVHAQGLVQWFTDDAISQWDPHGLGGIGAIPTFNFVYAALALLAAVGFSSNAVLFIFLGGALVAAILGTRKLLAELDIRVDRISEWALSGSYGLGPICFQKAAAGHLFWLAAYAALPWFTAFAWRGCSRHDVRAFGVAALLYAISSTQIQFLGFDAFLFVAIAVVHRPSPLTWAGAAGILIVGLVHNANVFLAPLRPSAGFNIVGFHATLDWERGMSGTLLDLARMSGYLNHDVAGLPPPLHPIYAAAKMLLALLALIGIALQRDKRALVFGIVAAGALLFANGWKGPLQPLMQWWLFHASTFTVFRELFHIMALYALAVTILAALALSKLPKRVSIVFPLVALAAASPFLTLGLNRLVPNVGPDRGEHRAAGIHGLRVLLPMQEPVARPGLASGGLDPARLVSDVASAGDPPLVLQAVLDGRLSRPTQEKLLADMGISRIAWRSGWASDLPDAFEPGVGAIFTEFQQQQQILRRRYTAPSNLSDVRSLLSLESVDASDPISSFLADYQVPPGRDISLVSSFVGNDIHRMWVSSRVWSWYAPNTDRVLGQPVYTTSSAPLSLPVHAATGTFIYILTSGKFATLDGMEPISYVGWRSSSYHWLRWRLTKTEGTARFRSVGFSSVARVIVSGRAGWSPNVAGAPHSLPARALPTSSISLWTVTSTLPSSTAAMRLVYARSYSSGWHLSVDGHDLGSAHRADGIFNGWIVGAAARPRTLRLFYAEEVPSATLILVDAVLELTILALLLFCGRPSRSS